MTHKGVYGGVHRHRERQFPKLADRNEFISFRRGSGGFRVCFKYTHLPDLVGEDMAGGTGFSREPGREMKLLPDVYIELFG